MLYIYIYIYGVYIQGVGGGVGHLSGVLSRESNEARLEEHALMHQPRRQLLPLGMFLLEMRGVACCLAPPLLPPPDLRQKNLSFRDPDPLMR